MVESIEVAEVQSEDGVSSVANVREALGPSPIAHVTNGTAVESVEVAEVPSSTSEDGVSTVANVREALGPSSIAHVTNGFLIKTVEVAEILSSTSEDGVTAVVNVQEAPCTETAQVVEKVRVLNGFANGELHSCRMGEDITVECLKKGMHVMGTKEEISYKSYSHSYTYKEEMTVEEKTCVGDRINGLKISTVSLECQNSNENGLGEYKERRIAVELSQDHQGERTKTPESDEDLPVHKRPKNCKDDCSFAQCCHLPLTPVENICHNGVASATVERPLIC